MPVYVDHFRVPYGRMKMSHMIADTPAELHAMADKIGVDWRWFQKHSSMPHYDICESKRRRALAEGAIALSDRRDLSGV